MCTLSSGGEMTRKDVYWAAVDTILTAPFDTRFGYTVPTTETVKLKDGAVYIDAVYLYADMADSSGLARRFTAQNAARIVRAYLSAVVRVVRDNDGEVRSYDGDRVMAIFIGKDAPDRAARAALEVTWVVNNVVRPDLSYRLDSYRTSSWVLSHRTGIDLGQALVVRAGVRDNNDLIFIGDAPNAAAKLSDLKLGRTMITDRLREKMTYWTCYSGATSLWTAPQNVDVGGRTVAVRYSNEAIEVK